MPTAEQEARLRITGRDETAAAFRSAARNMQALEGAAKRISSATESMIAGLKGLATVEGLRRATMAFADMERDLNRLGIRLKLSRAEMENIRKAMEDVEEATTQPLEDLIQGFATLQKRARTTRDEAIALMPAIGAAALQSGQKVQDVAEVVASMMRNLGIQAKDVKGLLADMAKTPAFDEMASFLPKLTEDMRTLGFRGVEGMRQILATLGALKDRVGSVEAAAEVMETFGARADDIAKKLNLERELSQVRKQGGNVFQFLLGAIERAGDQVGDLDFVLGELFGARNVMKVRALLNSYDDIQRRLRQLTGDVAEFDANTKRLAQDPRAAVDRLNNAWDDLLKAMGAALDRMGATEGMRGFAEFLKLLRELADELTGAFDALAKAGLNVQKFLPFGGQSPIMMWRHLEMLRRGLVTPEGVPPPGAPPGPVTPPGWTPPPEGRAGPPEGGAAAPAQPPSFTDRLRQFFGIGRWHAGAPIGGGDAAPGAPSGGVESGAAAVPPRGAAPAPAGPTGGGAAPSGGRQLSGNVDAAIEQAAAEAGVDSGMMRAFAEIESGGRPTVQTGSYKGLFQLSEAEFAEHGGRGDIFDPVENARAAAHKLKSESEQFRTRYGRAPTGAELYMIHQQGWGGYHQHTAQPKRAAWESMYATAEGQRRGADWAKQAVWGNLPASERRRFGSVENITSGQFLDFWRQRYARAEGRAAAVETPAAASTPEDTAPGAGQPTLGPQAALAFARQHLGEDEIADRSKLSAFFRSKGLNVDPATTAWCAGFVNANLQSAGVKGTASLVAGSFTRWGGPVEGGAVQPGDVGVVRGTSPRSGIEGKHVGFLTGETRVGRRGLEVKMLGGNQPGTVSRRGGVSEQWYPASRLHIRRATEREYRAMPDAGATPSASSQPAPSPSPELPPAPAAPQEAPAPESRRPSAIDEIRGVREEMEEPIQLRFERDIGEEQFRRASMRREVDREVREARWDSFADIGAA
jgi:uncharacterized protein (TIGR02594 family)